MKEKVKYTFCNLVKQTQQYAVIGIILTFYLRKEDGANMNGFVYLLARNYSKFSLDIVIRC